MMALAESNASSGMQRPRLWLSTLVLTALALPGMLGAQGQQVDPQYTAKIKEYTTEPFFLTKYVDHLPLSSTVPSPLKHFGDIAGAPNVLHYADEIHAYYRALEKASPRLKTFSMGMSEEGREMLLAAISSEQNLQQLEQIRQTNLQLADPRRITEQQADELIARGKAMYWLTGAIHSTETGSPEMLIELAYRLAVSEEPYIRMIRDSMIVFITPVVEVDGRARVVDQRKARLGGAGGGVAAAAPAGERGGAAGGGVQVPLIWWGHYVAHDNNRDNIGLSLKLSQHVTRTFVHWQPQVLHDLHESQPFLYASTGRGPYNSWLDPTTINEWNRLAFREVKELTEIGVPGVFTHDYYDGWAPNYMFFAANVRNSIGRFYEVQSASGGNAGGPIAREWHRPNPPLPTVRWSIRNNNNLSQSGVIIAMDEVARHKSEYLRTFYIKAKKSVSKPTLEGPAAYVFPATEPRLGQQARLLQLMQRHGVEVHRLGAAASVEGKNFPAGSYVIRMDQPFSRLADMLLDKQYYSTQDPPPYDDTGWTLGPLFNVQTERVEDAAILTTQMTAVSDTVRAPGGAASTGSAIAYLVNYNADNNLTTFRFKHRTLRIDAAERSFTNSGREFSAGSFIIRTQGNPGNLAATLDAAGKEFGFAVYPATELPPVPIHPVRAPRVALLHNWQSTQTEGWARIGLDEYQIPYDYIGPQQIRDTPRLLDRWDVILIGAGTNPASLLTGVQGDRPIPYKKSALTPNYGEPATSDDIRGGMELKGMMNLMSFLNDGGTLVTFGSASALPVQQGLSNGVTIRTGMQLWAPGSVFRADVTDAASPITYGYGNQLGVFFDSSPIFAAGGGGGGRGGRGGGGGDDANAHVGATTACCSRRGGLDDFDVVPGRPRIMGQAMAQGGAAGGRGGRGGRAGASGARGAEPPAAGVEPPAAQGGRGGRGGGRGGGGGITGFGINRIVVTYAQNPRDLLISGGLDYGTDMAGTPALVHSRIGKGNVVMFSFNPFWRGETLGSYGLVFNTMLHHANLDAGGNTAASSNPAGGN